MSEPCPKCERDYTTAQAMKSYIDASKLAGDAAIERDKALAERDEARALVALLQKAPHGKAKCSCNKGPDTDGPEQECPEHGDVRWYSAWLEEASDAYNQAAAALNRIEVLLDPETAMAAGSIGSDRYFCESDIRTALDPTP